MSTWEEGLRKFVDLVMSCDERRPRMTPELEALHARALLEERLMSADVTTIGSKPGRDKPKCLMEADIAALTAWNRTHKRGLEGSK